MQRASSDRSGWSGALVAKVAQPLPLVLRWLWTTAILFAALGTTAAVIQIVVIGVLDITFARLATFAAIAASQGVAVVLLLKKADGGMR